MIVSLRLFGSTMRIIFGFIVLLSVGSPDRIVSATKAPNIVFILTDDQDLEIGGMVSGRDLLTHRQMQVQHGTAYF